MPLALTAGPRFLTPGNLMRRSSPLIVLLFGAACGSSADTSLCDKLDAATTDFAAKAGPCFSTVPSLAFTASVCRASIDKCSSADQQRITDYTNCIEALPACTPAAVQSWTTSFQGCTTALGPLQSGGGC